MDAGRIMETGTHSELLTLKGHYYNLVQAQQLHNTTDTSPLLQEAVLAKADDVEEHVEVVPEAIVDSKKSNKDISGKDSSKDADETAKKPEKAVVVPFRDVPIFRIFAMNRPEWPLVLVGTFGASLNGVIMPLFALIYSQMLGVFTEPDTEKMLAGARFWACMFVALAVGTALANFLQISMFGRCSSERWWGGVEMWV